jgi:hypothetical protein
MGKCKDTVRGGEDVGRALIENSQSRMNPAQ